MVDAWPVVGEVRSTNGPEVSAALTQSSHNVTAAS